MLLFSGDAIKPYNQFNSEELEKLSKVQHVCDLLLKEVDRICRKYNIQYFLAGGNLIGAVRHGKMIPWDDDVDIWMFPSELDKFKQHLDELGKDFRFVEPEESAPYYVDTVPRLNYLPSHYNDDPEREKKLNGLFEHIHLDFFLLTKLPKSRIVQHFLKMKLLFLYSLSCAHRLYIHYEEYTFFQKIAAYMMSVVGKIIPAKLLVRTINRIARQCDKRREYSEFTVYNDPLRLYYKNFKREDVSTAIDMQYGDMVVMVQVGYDRILKTRYGDKYMELPPEEERIPHTVPLSTITFDK